MVGSKGLRPRPAGKLAAACTLLLVIGCSGGEKPSALDSTELFALQQQIVTNQNSPVDYVVSKFDDHDVVFLGETHRIKHDPELVAALIPAVYERGVFILATEFANASDQTLIDSLVTAPEYDEALARHIQMNQYSFWPWQEYLDIYKAAWELNRSLAPERTKFRILGVNCEADWGLVKTQEDLDKPAIRKAVWNDCWEKDWADIVLAEVAQGHKVLCYSGMHHAFTRYRQPVVENDGTFIRHIDDRFGNYVYDSIGDRAMTICLHYPWYSRSNGYSKPDRLPISGAIDQVMESQADKIGPVGFDVVGTPFGDLTDDQTTYAAGYDDFTLATFCDGYIYQGPFSETEYVTFADGFYNGDNIELARRRVPNPSYRVATPEDFESTMKKEKERTLARYRELSK